MPSRSGPAQAVTSAHVRSRGRSTPTPRAPHRSGNFDIIFVPFLALFPALSTPTRPHAPWNVLYLAAMLIGCLSGACDAVPDAHVFRPSTARWRCTLCTWTCTCVLESRFFWAPFLYFWAPYSVRKSWQRGRGGHDVLGAVGMLCCGYAVGLLWVCVCCDVPGALRGGPVFFLFLDEVGVGTQSILVGFLRIGGGRYPRRPAHLRLP